MSPPRSRPPVLRSASFPISPVLRPLWLLGYQISVRDCSTCMCSASGCPWSAGICPAVRARFPPLAAGRVASACALCRSAIFLPATGQ
eukprot:454927-Pyramimonas_sp.AAC.1